MLFFILIKSSQPTDVYIRLSLKFKPNSGNWGRLKTSKTVEPFTLPKERKSNFLWWQNLLHWNSNFFKLWKNQQPRYIGGVRAVSNICVIDGVGGVGVSFIQRTLGKRLRGILEQVRSQGRWGRRGRCGRWGRWIRRDR